MVLHEPLSERECVGPRFGRAGYAVVEAAVSLGIRYMPLSLDGGGNRGSNQRLVSGSLMKGTKCSRTHIPGLRKSRIMLASPSRPWSW